jgi:hypothetical protein
MSIAHEQPMTTLFELADLDEPRLTGELATSDLDALRAVAGWITTFVARPHNDLGRPGPVCPFVPGALERHTLWLALEHLAQRSISEVAQLVRRYQQRFKDAAPVDGDDATYKSIVLVFPDLPEGRADEFFSGLLEHVALPSYESDGFVMGGFHERNAATAIYRATFRPFTSPVPFLLIRHAVVSDWKFFLDNDDFRAAWARRYGGDGAEALAEAMRTLPWRQRGQ